MRTGGTGAGKSKFTSAMENIEAPRESPCMASITNITAFRANAMATSSRTSRRPSPARFSARISPPPKNETPKIASTKTVTIQKEGRRSARFSPLASVRQSKYANALMPAPPYRAR